jgi:fermentation-respiration switch protein FrsA (DUF1100 family)
MLALVFIIFILYVLYPIYQVYHLVRPPRFLLRSVSLEDYGWQGREVQFNTPDGLLLSGWYVPSQNRAAVILVHGYGGNRLAMTSHAKILIEQGYGVLLYDSRAHGHSEGRLFAAGWDAAGDVLGALNFLRIQADVDSGRVGALGVSVGGQTVIRAAGQTDKLQAIVADGPNLSSLKDVNPPTSLRGWLYLPRNWLYDKSLRWHTGLGAPPPLAESLQAIAPRPILLIATGRGRERRVARKLYEAASESNMLWEIPKAQHASGWLAYPKEYAAQITSFFNQALLAPD